MKVINGDFGKTEDSLGTIQEQVNNALEELGVGQETEGAFLMVVETNTGLHTAANERIGDSLLTIELVKHSLIKAYVEDKGA